MKAKNPDAQTRKVLFEKLPSLTIIKQQIIQVNGAKNKAVRSQQYEKAAELRDIEKYLVDELSCRSSC
jgi:protein-arginine kinase activator protein McsA